MWMLLIALSAVVVMVGVIIACALFIRSRRRATHEVLNQTYVYRAEPHADQVTEHPSKLHDNPVTDVSGGLNPKP